MTALEFNTNLNKIASLLNSFAYNLTKNMEDAKDLFQETLIALIEKIQKGNLTIYDNVSVNTFLGSIARRLWLKVLDRRGKRGTRSLDDLLVVPSEADSVLYELETGQSALFDADAIQVKKCLATMPHERILLIVLRYSLGYGYEDIMQILKIEAASGKDPALNVRQRLFNAMNSLKGCVSK